ncbi:MAG: hypothetical protein AAGI48_00660 [Verrucomicrobiota bacterium]
MQNFRGARDAEFYQAALTYSQSLWMQGKPAQAVLQLNKAWMAELSGEEEVLRQWPAPYRVLLWMLRHAPTDRFLGNPVRHFQHLATRVRGPGAVVRSWRAWACFHLSEGLLPPEEHPPDHLQIEREGIRIPECDSVIEGLRTHGWKGEVEEFVEALEEVKRA